MIENDRGAPKQSAPLRLEVQPRSQLNLKIDIKDIKARSGRMTPQNRELADNNILSRRDAHLLKRRGSLQRIEKPPRLPAELKAPREELNLDFKAKMQQISEKRKSEAEDLTLK